MDLYESLGGLVRDGEEPDPVVDKAALDAKIADAEELDEDDYTPETWGPFETALGEAVAVNEDDDATQVQVNEALSELKAKMRALVKVEEDLEPEPDPVVDKAALDETIAEAEELHEDDYTPETWELFATALGNAIAVNEDENATQEQVDEVLVELNTKIRALEKVEEDLEPDPVVDKAALDAKIAEAEELHEGDYTSETWEPFVAALAEAVAINEDDDATQEDVDEVLGELNTKIRALEKVEEEPEPEPDPTVTVNVRNASDFLPALIQIKVGVEGIVNATQFDVHFALSGGESGITSKFDLDTWSTESIFFNPKTITDKITIRIYDKSGNLLHSFIDVVIANPLLPE